MENNVHRNDRIQRPVTQHLLKHEKSVNASDIPAIENLNWLLHRHYTRHEYKTCKIFIEDELKRSNGQNEYAHYLKGIILRKEGRIQDSLDSFQNCYNINSTNVNNAKQIAKSLFLLGSHKRALEVFIEAEKISDKLDWEIYHNLGECYIKLHQYDEAIKYLQKAIEMTKNEIPYITLAKLYISQNQIIEAMNVYTAAIKNTPENEDMSVELGLLYLKVGDYKRAFQHFGTALVNSNNYIKAILPMAFIMQSHQEYDVALSKYKIASQSMSESWVMWNNVGMCFYGKQKFVAAISCLKRSHYLNPLAMLPASNLGIVLLTTGQPASAAIYLSAAISINSDALIPHLLLGMALKKLNDTKGAEASFSKALSLSPQDPLVLINYAIFLEADGRNQRAQEILTILNDAATVIDVDSQISETTKKLTSKLQNQSNYREEDHVLASDEV